MLAEALAPHGGVVMWRAFVYDAEVDPDRAKRAYKEFVPLDGLFHTNVFVQPKNGPIDFQPREPIHPLLGAMPRTPLMLELQITQEYLGHAKHLVFLAPMWIECLTFDTFAQGPASPVAQVIDGSLFDYAMTGIAGVANTGSDRNWCGHHFAQANEVEYAVAYLLEAGDFARNLYDDSVALDHYEKALTLLRQQDDHSRTARTLMKIGLTHHNNLNFAASRKAYEEGFRLLQQPSLVRHGRPSVFHRAVRHPCRLPP